MEQGQSHETNQLALLEQALRRAVSAKVSAGQLLKTLLLETITALDAGGGAIYLRDGEKLEVFGSRKKKRLPKSYYRKLIDERGNQLDSLILDSPKEIATILWLNGHPSGIMLLENPQGEDAQKGFSGFQKAIFIALGATASVILERTAVESELALLKAEKAGKDSFPNMIGNSEGLQQVKKDISIVTSSGINVSVLITGATGTGKEVVANAIHAMGERKNKKLITLNCAEFPEALLESTLFGHEQDAFTGAKNLKKGFVELANGGTLFLDEIGDMPLTMQVKLLRTLEDGSYRRVGGTETLYSDFQLISATNKNLEKEIQQGNFREDLLARINDYTIFIPPLSARVEDILPIAKEILHQLNEEAGKKQIAGFTEKTKHALLQYGWPGNVRQLKKVIKEAFIRAQGKFIDFQNLPMKIRNPTSEGGFILDSIIPLDDVVRKYVRYAYNRCDEKTAETMQHLNIDHRRLSRYLGDFKEENFSFPMQYKEEWKAVRQLDPHLKAAGLTDEQRANMKQAVIEAMINAIEHSDDPTGKIKIRFNISTLWVKISISDKGKGFDPNQIKEFDPQERIKSGKTRGWGFHIIRNSVDRYQIKFDNPGTTIILEMRRNRQRKTNEQTSNRK